MKLFSAALAIMSLVVLGLSCAPAQGAAGAQAETASQRINRVRIPAYLAQSMAQKAMLPHDIGILGNVVLEVLVGKNGRILKVRSVSGDSRLVRAAKPTMMKWMFTPFFLDGKPVQFLTQLTIEFDGNNGSAKLKVESDPLAVR